LDNQFTLDSTNGLLLLNSSNPLDSEEASRLDLTILITSRQDPKRYAQAMVQVLVDDVNDCAPQFEQQHYTIELPEDAKMADKLLQTKAVDLDLGANGIVRYSLDNDAPDFVEINLNDGRLLVKQQPGEDQLKVGREYLFHITSTDQG
jgi:protocadherin Fat 1/2/3